MITSLRRHQLSPQLSAEIERISKDRLGRSGLERGGVRGDLGHAGEPAPSVEAWDRRSPGPIDPEARRGAARGGRAEARSDLP